MRKFPVSQDYTWPVTIASYEADRFSRLRPSAQLRLQQEIGEKHLAAAGLTYREFFRMGAIFVVTKLSSKTYRAPVFEEEVLLTTWPRDIKGAQLFRCYRFSSPSGEPLIDCTAAFAVVDTQSHRLMRPSIYMDLCGVTNPDRRNDCADPGRIRLPGDLEKVGERPVLYSDIDYNGHLNNTVYADFLVDFLPGGISGREITEFSINYEHEAVLGDTIELFARKDGDTVFFRGAHGRGSCFTASCRVKAAPECTL